MASEAATITQAVVEDLNAQSWPVPLTAERKYLSPLTRVGMGSTVHVHVFPVTLIQERASRGANSREYAVVIHIRRAVDPTDTDQVDELIETLEDIADHYQDAKRIGGATVESAEPAGPSGEMYDVTLLSADRVFVGGVILNLKLTE